ncbi:hypothetical protein HK096_005599, partial [Nowakowskiella sp. JEL0078]
DPENLALSKLGVRKGLARGHFVIQQGGKIQAVELPVKAANSSDLALKSLKSEETSGREASEEM